MYEMRFHKLFSLERVKQSQKCIQNGHGVAASSQTMEIRVQNCNPELSVWYKFTDSSIIHTQNTPLISIEEAKYAKTISKYQKNACAENVTPVKETGRWHSNATPVEETLQSAQNATPVEKTLRKRLNATPFKKPGKGAQNATPVEETPVKSLHATPVEGSL